MIISVAKKEFRDAWRDGRFRFAAAIVLVLLGVAVLLAWQQVERTSEERTTAADMERDNWLNQGQKNSHSAGHYGVYVFKPIAPLAVLDRGIEPFVGTTVFLEAHRRNQAAFLPAQDATSMRRFGELTAASSLQLLAPLLIILLAFGTLAGERERGTLRQVLSLGIRPRDLVLGKAIGLGAALASLLLPAAVFGGIALSKISGSDLYGADAEGTWARFAWMCGAYATYLIAILAICLTVSALAPTSRSALVILLVCWAGNAVLVPRLASDLAQRFLPTPKLTEFETDMNTELKNKGLLGHHPSGPWVQDLARRTLQEHGKTSIRELPFNFQGLLMQEAEKRAGEIYDQHYARLWDRLESQDSVVTWSGLIAPLQGLRSASMALAGTDFAHHRHFSQAAEKHRLEFVGVLNKAMMDATQGSAGRELWEKLPPFEYRPPTPSEALGSATPGLIVLCLWALGAWIVLIAVAPRLKPN